MVRKQGVYPFIGALVALTLSALVWYFQGTILILLGEVTTYTMLLFGIPLCIIALATLGFVCTRKRR